MAVISFKSVGKTVTTAKTQTIETSPIPIGIQTPVRSRLVETDGIFAMHYAPEKQINDNLRNLIETNWGERLGLYDFGANLRELAFEITAREDFESDVMIRIKEAVQKWMPYVVLNGFELSNDYEEKDKTGVIRFRVYYDVPAVNASNQSLDVVMYVS